MHEAIENPANNKPIQVTNKGTKLTAQDNPNLDEALPACRTRAQTQLANNNTIYITNENAQYKIPTPTTSESESKTQRVSTAPPSPHPQILQHHVHYKTNHTPINDRQETTHQVPSPAFWHKTSPKKHNHQIPTEYPTYLHTSYPKKQSTTSQTGYTMRIHPHNGPLGSYLI